MPIAFDQDDVEGHVGNPPAGDAVAEAGGFGDVDELEVDTITQRTRDPNPGAGGPMKAIVENAPPMSVSLTFNDWMHINIRTLGNSEMEAYILWQKSVDDDLVEKRRRLLRNGKYVLEIRRGDSLFFSEDSADDMKDSRDAGAAGSIEVVSDPEQEETRLAENCNAFLSVRDDHDGDEDGTYM